MIHNGTLPSKRFSMTEQYVIGLEFAGQKLLGSRTICEWTSPIHTSNHAAVCSTFRLASVLHFFMRGDEVGGQTGAFLMKSYEGIR